MKRYLSLIIICFAALHMLAAEQVTIDARDLKLYEGYAGFPLYILQMEASGSTAQIRLQVHATAEDYTGTYTIDGSDNSALVLPAGAAASQATQATSGSIIISRPEGDVLVTGSVKCANGVTYVLNLRTDPVATRHETLTLSNLTLEDRILSENEFQIYGLNEANDLYLQLSVFTTMLEGTYTSRDIYKDGSQVRLGKSYAEYVYYYVLAGNLTVRKSGNLVIVTGAIICQNESNVNDIVEYTLYLSCVRDKKDQPMTGDATDADFEATFTDYTLDTSEQAINGDIFVYARNSEGQCVALDIYIAEGETEITAGTYPVLQGTDLSNPYMSVHASEGVISGFTTPSYAGYLNAASELQSPVWYIMAGWVIIDDEGRIEVNALNSAERTIHCILRGKPQLQSVESVGKERKMNAQKFIRDGQLLIRIAERTYNMQGKEVR